MPDSFKKFLHQKELDKIDISSVLKGHNVADDEKLLMIVRKHWSIEIMHILRGVFLVVVPFVVWLFVRKMLIPWDYLGLLVCIILAQFSILYTAISWVDYYLDVIVVTNKKLITIEQKGFFNRSFSETSLSKVQDASGVVKGLLGTMMHYGDVRIETAAENSAEFGMKEVGHPVETAGMILDIQSSYFSETSGNRSSI